MRRQVRLGLVLNGCVSLAVAITYMLGALLALNLGGWAFYVGLITA